LVLRTIVVLILAALVGGIAFIASLPSSFLVERTATTVAQPEAVFALLNDFHQWSRWSPWEKADPDVKRTFDGPASGPGAGYAWSGSGDGGEGRMKIIDAKPGKSLTIELEFSKPFPAKGRATFTLLPLEGGTRVRWSMKGDSGFVGKAMSLASDTEALVDKDLAQGLANLDQAARSAD
jgi:uncharacterized protein YndB with AHSA1/START domain